VITPLEEVMSTLQDKVARASDEVGWALGASSISHSRDNHCMAALGLLEDMEQSIREARAELEKLP
jgi:hypothetical protein